MSISVLSEQHIKTINELNSVKEALSGLNNANKFSFTIEIPNDIKVVIKDNLGLDLLNIKNVPMTWLIGDSLPHIDTSRKAFETTYLIYLTDDEGELVIDDKFFSMKKGFGLAFKQGLRHGTRNSSANPRLLIGPMSEEGFGVGGPTSGLFFFRSIGEAAYYGPGYTPGDLFYITTMGVNIIPDYQTASMGGYGDYNIFSLCSKWYVVRTNLPAGHSIANGMSNFFATNAAGGIMSGASFLEFTTGDELPYQSSVNGEASVPLLYNLAPATGETICFIGSSIVETDQGYIKIEEIDKNYHTISKKKIVGLVKSNGDIPCLAHIKPNLISENIPNIDTYCSVWHKILFNGEMLEAQVVPGTIPFPYSNEPLYNILLETYSIMKVNNMIVETLHPESSAAKLYLLSNL